MTNLWPILTLLAPLTVTVFSGRSAWLWLYLVASLALMFGLVKYVIYQFGQGNTDPLFKTLLLSNSADHRAAAVDRAPSAPCRAVTDIVLFWGAVAFALIAHYGVVMSTMMRCSTSIWSVRSHRSSRLSSPSSPRCARYGLGG
jgi:hypothetical protein